MPLWLWFYIIIGAIVMLAIADASEQPPLRRFLAGLLAGLAWPILALAAIVLGVVVTIRQMNDPIEEEVGDDE